jgi:YhcH/YjgK/YiaL family protein
MLQLFMKQNIDYCICVFFLFAMVSVCPLQAQQHKLSTRQAASWYKKGEWKAGISFRSSSSINESEFTQQYLANPEWWKKAFAFMNDRSNDTLSPGVYKIHGDTVFAKVTEIPSKAFDVPKWEAHRHYHDIHYVISGKERIGIGNLSGAVLTDAYDSSRDISFYTGTGKYYVAGPREFFIIPPHQVHRPGIKLGDYAVVKKIVIKVRHTDH